jgi:hypothetical protein
MNIELSAPDLDDVLQYLNRFSSLQNTRLTMSYNQHLLKGYGFSKKIIVT